MPNDTSTHRNNSAEHSALVRDALIALNKLPNVDFAKLVNWSGMTGDRRIKAGMTSGASDIIGTVHGRRVDLEAKTGTGRQSSDQIAWQKRIRRAGGVCEVFRSVDEALDIVRRVIAGEL